VEQEEAAPDVDGAVEDVLPEDVETPDEGTTEDIAPEEDGGVEETTDVPDVEDVLDTPEADVVDTSDVEDVPEVESSDGEEADATDVIDADEDSVEFVDGDAEATDTYDCTETITTVAGTPVSGPELLCGSTQTATPTFEETSWVGADCEGTSTTRRMIRKDVVLTPPLDAAGLACARGTATNALNGTELIVDLTSADFNTAITVVPCEYLWTGGDDRLDGGVAEYIAQVDVFVSPSQISMTIRPPSGSPRGLSAYDTGVAEVWTHDRGYVAFGIDDVTRHTWLCYVYVPIMARIVGFGEVWTVDGGTFTFNQVPSGDGTQLLGWEWIRP
jgi:hypothetical protein